MGLNIKINLSHQPILKEINVCLFCVIYITIAENSIKKIAEVLLT